MKSLGGEANHEVFALVQCMLYLQLMKHMAKCPQTHPVAVASI